MSDGLLHSASVRSGCGEITVATARGYAAIGLSRKNSVPIR